MKLRVLAISIVSTSLVLGCTWVKPQEGTDAIALVKPNATQNCKKLGTTTSAVKDKVGFINRGERKVALELATLAKNSALEMGGDTIATIGQQAEGKQKFGVYKCRP